MDRIIQYKFDVREILNEVTSRTSLIATHRVSAEQPDRLDELTLTEGEFSTFHSLLEKAASDVYSYTAAFNKNLREAYWCGDTLFDSVGFNQERKVWFDDNAIPRIKNSLKEALVNHIISRWFVVALPEEAANYWALYEEAAQQAQLGMNKEFRTLKRGTNWLH